MKFHPPILTTVLLLGFVPRAFAVSPLITDDADTVPQGEFELVLTFEHARDAGGERLNPLLFTLTYGHHPQLEAGVETGWLWSRDENSMADTTVAMKWKARAEEDPAMLFAVGFETKLPTASRGKGLGSGDPDFSLIGIFTTQAGPDTGIDMINPTIALVAKTGWRGNGGWVAPALPRAHGRTGPCAVRRPGQAA